MADQAVSSLMYQLGSLKQELEKRSSSILGTPRIAFQDMFIRTPRTSPPELAFYQIITWLYALYYEAGRVSLLFLIEKVSAYGLQGDADHHRHYEDVGRLRTYLQHNLNLDSKHDLETQQRCEEWFLKRCGTAMPGIDNEWRQCSNVILKESEAFLSALVGCVRRIEGDEASKTIVEQWSIRLRRFHPKEEFERLVAIVIKDIGQEFLDVNRLAAQHYDRWSKNLRSRSADFDFDSEARKLIEQTILNEAELPLPITGQDIMREFGIPSGQEVGRILRKARSLYLQSPCNKEQLISRLRDSMLLAS